MILFIDACVRKESRTRELANHLLSKLKDDVTHIALNEIKLPELNQASLEKRIEYCAKHDYNHPIFDFAKQFASAETIVIAAPFWDLSFPAIFKRYIESICVSGVTFKYSKDGVPVGLCKAKNLYYVTTSGGQIMNNEFGFGYVKTLATIMFGIENCQFISAEALDIIGNDVAAILDDCKQEIDTMFS